MKRSSFALPYGLWMLLFTIVPIFLIFYYAFTYMDEFTLENFRMFLEPEFLGILAHSLYLGGAVHGAVPAHRLSCGAFPGQPGFKRAHIVVVLFVIPMWMNFLLRTYAWMTLLEDTGHHQPLPRMDRRGPQKADVHRARGADGHGV